MPVYCSLFLYDSRILTPELRLNYELVRTSLETHYVSTTEPNRLMLFVVKT
jgi:hypothetical protein